jgi:tRNA(Ile)-lysidine synthase
VEESLLRLAASARAVAALLSTRAREVIAANLRTVTPWRIELRLREADAPERPVLQEVVRRLLQRVWPRHSVPWSHVERAASLLSEPAGKRLQGPAGPLVERTRWGLLLVDVAAAGTPPSHRVPVSIDGATGRFGSTEWAVTATTHRLATIAADRDRFRAVVDPARAPTPWSLRTRRPGERFHPLGMPAPVELTRFLSRRQVPRFDRDRMPLVVDREDRIVWVPGAEINATVRVTEDTESCVELRAMTSGGAGA